MKQFKINFTKKLYFYKLNQNLIAWLNNLFKTYKCLFLK